MYVTSQFCNWMVKTVKMGINFLKSWFVADRSGESALFTDYINIKNAHSVVFFIFYSKRYVKVTSGVVYKFQCGLYNESYYGKCVRHLTVRIGELIRIILLTKKKVKPKGSAASDHLLLCNHSPSFENFNLLTRENKKSLN